MLDETKHRKQRYPLRRADRAYLVVALAMLIGAVFTIRPFLLLGVDLFITAATFVAIALIERYGRRD